MSVESTIPSEIKAVSVRDENAFITKHLPESEHESKDIKVFTWALSNWSTLAQKETSPTFECGDYKWRVLLFPFGNSSLAPNETVSLYLECLKPVGSQEWHACAEFALVASNVHDPMIHTVSSAHHRFTQQEPDWGFTRFSEINKLLGPKENQLRPTIEGDSVNITVFIRVLEDPTGVLWLRNFEGYDVGLRNQGATAYMNSLLQPIFFLRYLRQAIYQIPTENHLSKENVALALQRLFYALETSNKSVSASGLTASFGWKSLDAFIPHDVYEFYEVFGKKLESILKDTRSEGVIKELFSGNMKSYIKCLNVEYESSRSEEFYGLSLKVKNIKNLHGSLEDYTSPTLMKGEGKYLAPGFGLQEAKKGIIFESFPPVLVLRLERFHYDIGQDKMDKVYDRYEYPSEINLEKFLDSKADRSQPWVYQLYTVIVHSGDLTGGHNFSFVRPTREGQWCKFDDDRVTLATNREVLEKSYEGTSSAYVLIYVRKSAAGRILAPLPESIPPHIRNVYRPDIQTLFLTVKVVTDETFTRHEGFDLATFDAKDMTPSDLPSFRVLKKETYGIFKSRMADHFNYREDQIRFWGLVKRQNKTIRVERCIPDDNSSLTIEEIYNQFGAPHLLLYLDIVSDAKPYPPPPDNIMFFLKHFDPSGQTLLGLGKVHISKACKIDALIPIINAQMDWASNTPLKLYEEIRPGMIEVMKNRLSFAQSEIQNGDIICFQPELSKEEIHDLEHRALCSNPIRFYESLQQNCVIVLFRPKVEQSYHQQFKLAISKTHSYSIVVNKVGKHLNYNPMKLRLTTPSGEILGASPHQNVGDILTTMFAASTAPVVLYEKVAE